ncbi:hypothetical protein [Nocardia xishanensis]|uniref:Uncharacterized protein n=1 Tax=Nocardia xishanensis TaxID=238964 RepID=A0ABW7XC81_9NOCA
MADIEVVLDDRAVGDELFGVAALPPIGGFGVLVVLGGASAVEGEALIGTRLDGFGDEPEKFVEYGPFVGLGRHRRSSSHQNRHGHVEEAAVAAA